jgi:hypothetical protein
MLRITTRILSRLPLSWAVITANVVGTILIGVYSSPLRNYGKIYSAGLTILLAIASMVLLRAGCRYVLDYKRWRRMQLRRGQGRQLKAYVAYAWLALRRRHRRWPRVPLSELLAAWDESLFSPIYWLAWQAGMCFNAWVWLDKWSFLAVVQLQVVSDACWVLTKRYTPRQHRSWRIVSPGGKVSLSFSPKSYKANRLRDALLCSAGAVLMGGTGVDRLLTIYHTSSTQDILLSTLATLGPAATIAFLGVVRWRAYLRWRRGQVTMDDVSEEIEWMLAQQAKFSGQRKESPPTVGLKEEYFEHKSNVSRVQWSWALRKHALLKQLRLRPASYYIVGIAGLLVVDAVVVLSAWSAFGTLGMWIAVVVIAIATALGIIAWIIGDDDELPPLPPANKPIPTPGRGLALPKSRPKFTTHKPQGPLLKP